MDIDHRNLDVDYLTKKMVEEKDETESLTDESIIILVFSLVIVILLLSCLISVVCYDCIHTNKAESKDGWYEPKLEVDAKLSDIEDNILKEKWTSEKTSSIGSRKIYNYKNPNDMWL